MNSSPALTSSPPLYGRVADRIRGLIASGTLRIGDRIPSVRGFSRLEGVSISTVLLAYQQLEDGGYISARPQSGYYVRSRPLPVAEPEASRPPRRALTVEVSALADAVLAAAADPQMISFGSACPSGDMFPLERIRRALSGRARRSVASVGSYGLPPGSERTRRALARRALDWGCRLDHRRIVLTGGCMESLNLALRVVAKPGDTIALESPTYYGFLQILESLGLRALEVPTDPRNGISLPALEAALDAHPVKAVLAVPTVSNPLGATMPDAAKKRMVSLLAERRVPLIEDHIYSDLYFGDMNAGAKRSTPRAAKSFDRDGNVILVSSFSKSVAPGLKLGWIEAGRWSEDVRRLKFVASGGLSEVVELTIADLLESGGHVRSVRQLRRRLSSQLDRARAVIARHFPAGTRVTQPSGGFILWLELPQPMDSIVLFERALEEGISIGPGPMFSASSRYRNCLRLSLGQPWTNRVETALETLGAMACELAAGHGKSVR